MTEPISTPPDPSRTAVVLSSSFLGVYAHAGFLEAMDQAGFIPSRVSGSSAGALAAAFHASGLRGDALRDAALDPRLRRSFFDLGCLWRLPGIASSFWSSGIFTGKGTIAHLRGLLGDRDLSDLPLDIAVTNLKTCRAEVRRSGPLAETIMASCAVPALFTIQNIGEDRFLDGGIAAEHPYEQFIDDTQIDTVILHRIRHEEGSQPNVNWETVSNVVSMSHHTVSNELHLMRQGLALASNTRILEVTTTTPFPGILSNKLAPRCHELGRKTGNDFFNHP